MKNYKVKINGQYLTNILIGKNENIESMQFHTKNLEHPKEPQIFSEGLKPVYDRIFKFNGFNDENLEWEEIEDETV